MKTIKDMDLRPEDNGYTMSGYIRMHDGEWKHIVAHGGTEVAARHNWQMAAQKEVFGAMSDVLSKIRGKNT